MKTIDQVISETPLYFQSNSYLAWMTACQEQIENTDGKCLTLQSKIPLDWSNQFKVILSRTGWKYILLYILPSSTRFDFLKISGTGWKYILPTSQRFYLLKLSGTGRKYIIPTSTRFNFLKISGTVRKYILPTSPRII